MFNSDIIEKINKKISDFQKANFTLNGYSFSPSNYDIINANILSNCVYDEDQTNLFICKPHRNIFLLYAISILSLSTLLRDLTSINTSLEKNLNIGCRVKLDGSLGLFKGIEIRNKKKYFKIYCGGKNKDTIFLPILENLGRLEIYNGTASKLRGYKYKKSMQKSKDVISNILNIDKRQLNVVRQSQIAIITDKKSMLDLIKDLNVNDCKFTDIFPVAKLLCADKYSTLPGTRLEGRKPVIYFVSSFGTLFDYIQKGYKINTLIIDSASKIKNYFNDINSLRSHKNIENILIFSNHLDLYEKGIFEDIGFRSWVWTKKDFEELDALDSIKKSLDDCENPFTNYYKISKSLAKQKINLIDIAFPESETESEFNEAIRIIKKLNNITIVDNIRFNELLRYIFGYLFYFQHLIYPDGYDLKARKENNFYRSHSQYSITNIKVRKEELLSTYMSLNFENDFNELIILLMKIKESFSERNHKADKILSLLRKKSDSKIAIITRKAWQKNVFLEWLKNNDTIKDTYLQNRKKIDVIDFANFSKQKFDNFYDLIIFSGWYGYKNEYIFNTGISPRIIFLLYQFEKNQVDRFYDFMINDKYHLRNPNVRAELLGINPNNLTTEGLPKSTKHPAFEFKEDLTIILDDLNLKSFSDIGDRYHSYEKDAISAMFVGFEDGEFAFFTKNYKAKVLNEIKETIEIKGPEELEVGDEIVFLDNSRKDIFDEFIEISERNSSYSAEVKISKIWKNAIKKYIENSGKNVQIFTRELERYGCKRHYITVKNWIDNEHIIGPEKEKETLKSILEVTNDIELKNNLKKVVFACRKLRALHIRMGKYLAQCIFASIDLSQEKKLDIVMRNRIKDLSKCVTRVRIKMIDNNFKMVEKNKVNQLIEEIVD